ncbi:universal stress protein UspA [Halalkaliarchaeum desulfuricum]|uniref:Universal stress protein UspA n=1 Tax=Halalkaliarchaeum desulfuricum TaxID=2055893 RepID=A0A343TNM2_9EURY|nr:universal stress protein [Halalkaliarchaeum desulfuricum]AUX10694.1 universal stress protein UspA [Halalkaliarchaeum desulfuricum]
MDILVPVDDSDPAKAAMEFACTNHPNANVVALHVVSPPEMIGLHAQGAGDAVGTMVDRGEEAAEELLAEFRELAADHDVDIETEVIVGEVDKSILEFARDSGVDQIVIGSHGRTGWSRITLGSVAESVVRRSPVPVTVVHPPESA